MIFVRDFLTDQEILRSAMAPARPTVSVVLPTYRRGRNGMLERAIQSVLQQTFADLELLVIDDGSTDGSFDLIERYRATDPRVVHVRHERNSGIHSVRLNEGIELARGKYIAFQFDDDVWPPNALDELTTQASRSEELAIVVGRSRVHDQSTATVLPAVALNLVNLHGQNLIANNSVLIPREIFEEHGMYDCHLGMRRLCDWDLWLRYMKHVPFILVDAIVSDAYLGNIGSIGRTVPWDLTLFRCLHDIPRGYLLKPQNWHEFQVDSLRVGDVEIEKECRRRLYEEHIVPYYLKFRNYFPGVEGFSATLPRQRQSVLYTKASYDVSNDVALNHYDELSNRRGNYKAFFQPLDEVESGWSREADALLLVRTVEDKATVLMKDGLEGGLPVGFYLDDDLLTFHEYGPQFDYLAPGKPYYENLTRMLKRVDAAWVTSPFIGESVRQHNPRVLPHNGCVPHDWLPSHIRARAPGVPIRIGYVGSNYRLEEFSYLWDAFLRLSQEFDDQLIFEFWGLDTSALPKLNSPVAYKPFTFSYFHYLRRLREASFDILLTPLLDHPRPRLGKAPSKYYQAALAGALGIFSDVPQYASLPADITCLKAANTVDSWYSVLRQAVTMPPAQFDLLRRRALEHVRQEFTERAQIHLHEAAWRATEFHAKTRSARHADGRPRILYALPPANFGSDVQPWRKLQLARDYGIEPILALPRATEGTESATQLCESMTKEGVQVSFASYTCFREPRSPQEFHCDAECEDVKALLESCQPALVHTLSFIPSFGQVCKALNIPHVASLYAVEDSFAWNKTWGNFGHCEIIQSDSIRYAARWGRLLETETFCSRELVPESAFALGRLRFLHQLDGIDRTRGRRMRLVVMGTLEERGRQLEAIGAMGHLVQEGLNCQLDFYGDTHFSPEYTEKCRQHIHELGLQDRFSFRGCGDDLTNILSDADLVLSLSTFESFPSIIKEAMAAGVLVVATPAGGIPELVVDGVSGILCADASLEAISNAVRRVINLTFAERQQIVEQARRVARSEFHPQRIASDLMTLYNRAIEITRCHLTAGGPMAMPTKRDRMIKPQQPPGSVIPLDRSLRYRVTPSHANWIGLDIMIGTHQRRAAGRIFLRALSLTGQVLRESSANLDRVGDNSFVYFRFDPLLDAADQSLILEFKLTQSGPRTLVSLYDTQPPSPKMQRVFSRVLRWIGIGKPRDSLYCRMWYIA